ncbi:ATP-binding protein [Streptomyces sp. NPDC085942]|uniref:ATP-binding protein n=1 Tax=Streptomyces sp. NPDC085942 TaxID=3365743 RepID=UPI0037D45406
MGQGVRMTTMRPHPALPSPPACGTPAVPPQLICEAVPESVRAARRFVRAAAAYQEPGTPEDALGTLELLASELATNGVRAARSAPVGASIRVVVDASWGRARVEVHDASPRLPYVRPASTLAERGRGMLLVERMAAAWGYSDHAEGKCVWAAVTWR